MEKAVITDVTLREFGQNVPGNYLHIFTPAMRIKTAAALIDLGVKSMEVFSCVHPKVAPAMGEEDLRKIAAGLGRPEGVHIITLVPNLAGYRSFLRLGLGPDGFDHTLGVFFSAVEMHNLANLGRTIDATLGEYRTILKDADSRRIRSVAYVSATFGYLDPEKGEVIRPDLQDVDRWMDLLFGWGANTVTLSDLQGVADCHQTARTLETILDLRKGRDRDGIGYHPHHVFRDRALDNSMAAFQLGIRRFDASLGGTGGCVTGAPGNQPTEGLVRLFHEAGIETGIDEGGVSALAKTVQRDLYDRIPPS
jgi:hydroxymethylglutaryl-CoA lyase